MSQLYAKQPYQAHDQQSTPPQLAHESDQSRTITILPPGTQVVLILMGLIASGKSTFAQALEQHFPQFRRCNQDDLGGRQAVEDLVRKSLRDGLSVCIDRTNFDESQRATWINIAHCEFPGTLLWVLVFDTPAQICAERLATRTDHPTITSPEMGLDVLRRLHTRYRRPSPHEGYSRILRLNPSDIPSSEYSDGDIRDIIHRLQESPEVVPVGFRSSPVLNSHEHGRGYYPSTRSMQRGSQLGGAGPSYGPTPYRGTRGFRGPSASSSSNLQWNTRRSGRGSGYCDRPGRSFDADGRFGRNARGAREDRTEENWRARQP